MGIHEFRILKKERKKKHEFMVLKKERKKSMIL